MRPPPSKKHYAAIAILLGVVAANTLLTFRESGLTGIQANLTTEVYKAKDPSLYPCDDVFSGEDPAAAWRMHLPLWRYLLNWALDTGGGDPVNAFRVVGALTLLLYLLSMYVVLYRQTHSTAAATFVAVMSMAVFSYRRAYWGAGPLFTVRPETLFLCAVPLLTHAFMRAREKPTLFIVFFVAGLCANIHAWSALNLVLVMLVALLGLGRCRWTAWLAATACAIVAALGAYPALHHYFVTYGVADSNASAVSTNLLWDAYKTSNTYTLYPQVLGEAIRWLAIVAPLALPAGIILSRGGRYRLPDMGGWIWLLAAAIIVAYGLLGLGQLLYALIGRIPRRLELFDALRLAMLPLYVLFAQAMVHVLRMTRSHRGWMKAGFGLFLTVFLASSYNTQQLRHLIEDGIAALSDPRRPPRTRDDDLELQAIGRWAKTATHVDALFVTPNEEMRLFGQRSLTASPSDYRYLVRLAPHRLAEWSRRLAAQRRLLTPPEQTPAQADLIAAFVDEYWQQQPGRAAETYALIPVESAPTAAGRLEEIASPRGDWGKYWRAYRVLPPRPASAPSSTRTPTTSTTAPATSFVDP